MTMDSSLEGVALDPSKCSKLSMEKKRELVYEISKLSHGAYEMLQSWSRQEILQILCAEMGKERKYTGLTKLKIIEHLLKIVSEKKSGVHEATLDFEPQSSALDQKSTKRQRKTENPSRLPVQANNLSVNNSDCDLGSNSSIYCKNSACKATISREDAFCKRCSCCICHQYDDNKDPSLWLICSSEPPFLGASCGLSCHLECAIKHESSGIIKEGRRPKLDGSFYCVSCGKMNDLLGCWRKQLMMSKDTRPIKKLEPEVGPLTCSPGKMGRGIVNRLSSGPEVQKLCAFAVELLDSFFANKILHQAPNPKIQGSYVVSPKVRFEDVHATSLAVILGSEDVSEASIGCYTLWHRMAHEADFPVEPTCTLFLPNTRFIIRGLSPATKYIFKVVSSKDSRKTGVCEVHISTESGEEELPNCSVIERSQSPATNCSTLSNPSSVEDETNNSNPYIDQTDNRADNYHTYCKETDKLAATNLSIDAINSASIDEGGTPADSDSLSDKDHIVGVVASKPGSDVLKVANNHSPECQIIEDVSTDDGSNSPVGTRMECVPFGASSEAGLPITPCKLEILKDGLGRNGRSKSSSKDQENGIGKRERPQDGSTSKKRCADRQEEDHDTNGLSDQDFEYYVKVIRWLECEGHIEKNFRQKFLTWFSLRATPQEVRIVKVFVDTFLPDPAALAEQVVDTFSECISCKRTSTVPAGFCMNLWH
ncbi:VIN3-like protein 2 [Quillaja saponaria]|uniref:VIN3-like protein 2 n=1 Tax=Quillaja saponaria TaxID=32244 RepID=A0AAD7LCU4_QUISA|nr:VIN3-like protein 2 [Quillaja saponaria]